MSKKSHLSLTVLGTSFAVALAAGSLAAAENPFALDDFGPGIAAAEDEGEGTCGEGKCGETDGGDEGEGSCGEGKCGE